MATTRVNSDTWISICCLAITPAAGARSSPSRAAHLSIASSSLSRACSSLLHPGRSIPDTSTVKAPRLSTSTPSINPGRSSTLIKRLPTATDLASLKTPSLHCPFPALVHDDYKAVKEHCNAWIEAVAAPPSATSARILHDWLLPLLVCRFIPKAVSRQRLVHVIKLISWLIIADDDDDHPDLLGSDFSATSRRAELVMAILRGIDEEIGSFDCSFMPSTQPGFASKSARMLKALAELWLEIRNEMSPSLQARFISSMADYFEGLKVQASFRKEVVIPHMESYMEIRRKAVFITPCFILMEYALDINIGIGTIHNPIIKELHDLAVDYVILCNDIVSCRDEIHMGDYFNLPFIFYNSMAFRWSFISFQYVMDHVGKMVEDLNKHAILLISTIQEESKTFEPYMVPIIHAYVDGLSHCMSGTLAWSLESARYHQVNGRSELHNFPERDCY